MAFLSIAVSRAIVVCALSLSSTFVTAEPQNGWWWNPNESGRGFFIESTGGLMYLAGYFYASDGRATWLSSGGLVTDLYSYKGTLQSYRNGQSAFGAYRAPDPAADVGPVSVTFTDDTHGTITWPGGTIAIERQIFDQGEATFQPKTGWWWNPAESGSGFSVEIQGNNAFVVAFMYDESGNPVWYFTAGPMATPTRFEGDWLEFSGGQTLTGSYQPPAGTPKNLGRVTIVFAATDDATITFTEGGTVRAVQTATTKPSQTGGRSRSSRTGPQFPARTWSGRDYWPRFACAATQNFKVVSEAGSEGDTFTSTRRYSYHLWFYHNANRPGAYVLDPEESYVDYFFNTYDVSNHCRQSAQRSRIQALSGELKISSDLHYAGRVGNYGTVFAEVTESCPDIPSSSFNEPIPIDFRIGDAQSVIQSPNPFTQIPRPTAGPFMRVRNSLLLPDGSETNWGWDCTAQELVP